MRKLLLAAMFVALAACGGGNKLDRGEVVQKSYDDPDSWLVMQCGGYNQNGGCSVYIPITYSDGPHWNVQVTGYDDKGKSHKEWHEITEELFDRVFLGDTVDFNEMQVIPQ